MGKHFFTQIQGTGFSLSNTFVGQTHRFVGIVIDELADIGNAFAVAYQGNFHEFAGCKFDVAFYSRKFGKVK